jgi:putative sterol carrier protein
MSEQLTARMVMERMPSAFIPEKAEGVNAVIQYVLTGEGGGEWYSSIENGTCAVVEGRTDNPKVTITMDANDYVDLITGRLNAMSAFMTGKIKLGGDFGLASRLTTFFRAP